jgi:hypothetical protein
MMYHGSGELCAKDGVGTTRRMMKGCDKEWLSHVTDDNQALFHASTKIKLGNENKAIFWHDKWLDGVAPIDIALNLYKKAHVKRKIVARELLNKN